MISSIFLLIALIAGIYGIILIINALMIFVLEFQTTSEVDNLLKGSCIYLSLSAISYMAGVLIC